MSRKYRYLTITDRRKIAEWRREGLPPVEIAARLGVHTATIYRELQNGTDSEQTHKIYDPELAERNVQENISRRGKENTYCPPSAIA